MQVVLVELPPTSCLHTEALEFFARKNDTSIQLVSFHSKKRPHSLIFTRTHDSRILDMLEFHINPDTLEDMLHFRGRKTSVGAKPMIVFHGTPFESPVQTKYTLAKSLLLDFFRGEEVASMDVEGLQYLISISAGEESEGQPPPQIHLRVYTIRTLRSGQRLPRVEVEEMGPRLDFRVGREKFADEALWKVAMKKPKTTEVMVQPSLVPLQRLTYWQPKTKKNIQTDPLGDKIGKIHIGSQDLGKLQTRKMKGLKRSRTEGGEAETAGGGAEGEVPSCKKPKE